MTLPKLAAIGLAVLLVTVGAAAAVPGPADAPTDGGPPDDLPGPVPDFVEEILSLVGEFLDGSIDDLGGAVSDLVTGSAGA